jgi:ribose 5-phosphate isomerase RpiB
VAVVKEAGPRARFRDVVQHLEREVEQEAVPHTATAIQKATAAVQQQRKSVIWTALPTEAVCLANRQSDIWAVQGWDLNSTAQAMRHTQANLLVVDRNQHSEFMQRAIINSFLSRAV